MRDGVELVNDDSPEDDSRDEWRCKRCGQTFEEGPCPVEAKERAVIEAAKAVNKYWKTSAPEKLEALFRAIEALEKVER
jgi:hypothetical protein